MSLHLFQKHFNFLGHSTNPVFIFYKNSTIKAEVSLPDFPDQTKKPPQENPAAALPTPGVFKVFSTHQ